MPLQKDPKHLLQLLTYILERQPDEFGLVPDEDGFIKVKKLLQAVNEEDGWGYVRHRHIEEILYTVSDPGIEIKADAVRAKNRERLPRPTPAQNLPKLLYTCVRRKAHAVILEKGIFPMGNSRVVLSSSSEMAARIGTRKDPQTVLLTVHVQKMLEQGAVFHQLGQTLYLAESVPVDCFSSPPLAKQRQKPQKVVTPEEAYPQQTAGAFLVDLHALKQAGPDFRGKYRKKEIAWKKDRRLQKQRKNNIESDP